VFATGKSFFTFDTATGIVIADAANILYSLRTNFSGVVNHKVSVGYIYPFNK